jgi:predicted RNA-binding Zn-ribbon protein involved in translation (DUF1610 family)
MTTFQDVIGKITTTTVKAASSKQVVMATSKAAELGRQAATSAKGFAGIAASFVSVTKCPECKSISITRTDGGSTMADGFRCNGCSHEFTAIGPALRRGIIKGGVHVATVAVSTVVGVIFSG